MNEPQKIGVCALLFNSQKHLLLGRRKNSYKAGLYGLPGGRLEVNEKISEAVAREVFEETGLRDLSFVFLGVVRENQGDSDFIHFVFTAHVGGEQPRLCEPDKCEGWEWFVDLPDSDQVLPGHVAATQLLNSEKILVEVLS